MGIEAACILSLTSLESEKVIIHKGSAKRQAGTLGKMYTTIGISISITSTVTFVAYSIHMEGEEPARDTAKRKKILLLSIFSF